MNEARPVDVEVWKLVNELTPKISMIAWTINGYSWNVKIIQWAGTKQLCL